MKNNSINNSIYILLYSILNISIILPKIPAYSFVPYVYEPNPQNLYRTSLNIGRTATQLLQIGQNEQAALLAALAVRLQPNDERLWSVLAEAQHRSGEIEAAIISLTKAKEINPKLASVWSVFELLNLYASLYRCKLASKSPNTLY